MPKISQLDNIFTVDESTFFPIITGDQPRNAKISFSKLINSIYDKLDDITISGLTSYDVWIQQPGHENDTLEDFFNELRGLDGDSAYQIWLSEGYTGSTQQFLDSLKGINGTNGTNGTNGINGTNGLSAYEIWTGQTGNAGNSIATFLASLKGDKGDNGLNGKSAFDIWKEQPGNGSYTVQDYIDFMTGVDGENGTNGLSAYEIWTGQTGNAGNSIATFLASLKGEPGINGTNGTNGTNGKSAYELWLIEGNTGSTQQFFASFEGPAGENGLSAYEVWKSFPENSGKTETQFIEYLNGTDGKSAYEIWIEQVGHENDTVEDFFNALKGVDGINGQDGLSAYEVWTGQTGNSGLTEADFFATFGRGDDGKSAFEIWLEQPGNSGLTESDFFATFGKGDKGDQGLSAYEVWVQIPGNEEKSEVDFFATFGKGDQGISAYQVWLLEPDNSGKTENEFFEYLRGPQGLSAYEVWLAIPGNEGKTLEQFIAEANGVTEDMVNDINDILTKTEANTTYLNLSGGTLGGNLYINTLNVSNSINQLSGTTNQLTSSVNQLSGATSQLSGTTNQLTSSVNQLSGATSQLSGTTNTINQLYPSVKYLDRVNAITGSSIMSLDSIKDAVDAIIDLLPYTEIIICPETGLRIESDKVSALYDLNNARDATQSIASSRPYLSGNIAPNEKVAIKNTGPSTEILLTHSAITKTATDSWSIITTLKYTGKRTNGTDSGAYCGSGTTFYLDRANVGKLAIFSTPTEIASAAGVMYPYIGKNVTIIWIYNNGAVRLYINGLQINVSQGTIPLSINQLANGATGKQFEGNIYYHQVLSKELSTSEVKEISTFLMNEYPEIEGINIGNQHWATSNYESVITSNGTIIPEITGTSAWSGLTTLGWCYYDNDPSKGVSYGKLYNHYAIDSITANPPTGWRVPTDLDIAQLSAYLGGDAISGSKLKVKDINYWNSINNNTNESGLSLVANGFRNESGTFSGSTTTSYIWNSTLSRFYTTSTSTNLTSGTVSDVKSGLGLRLIRTSPVGQDKQILTTGVFTTDISSSYKLLSIPFGYEVKTVRVKCSSAVTGLTVDMYDYAGTTLQSTLLLGKTALANVEMKYNVLEDSPIQYQDPQLRITATKETSNSPIEISVVIEKIL